MTLSGNAAINCMLAKLIEASYKLDGTLQDWFGPSRQDLQLKAYPAA